MATRYSPKIVTDGLVLALDAANPKSYPGSGTTWSDLSGNGNHFTLFNTPTYNTGGYFTFDGTNNYARSTNTINLTSTNAVSVEIVFRVASVTANEMIFEHTSDWNTNSGAFGAFTNSTGGFASSPTTDNVIHMNSDAGRLDSGPSNDLTEFSINTMLYSNANGVTHYNNGVEPSTITSSTSSVTNFANAYTYIATRGGSNFYDGMDLVLMRIYSRELTAAEIQQNYNALKGRFGL